MPNSHSRLTDSERRLLDNVLDCLDRLFDNETKVIDVHALLIATHAALTGSPHEHVLENAESQLAAICRSASGQERQYDDALSATDELRKYLARILPS